MKNANVISQHAIHSHSSGFTDQVTDLWLQYGVWITDFLNEKFNAAEVTDGSALDLQGAPPLSAHLAVLLCDDHGLQDPIRRRRIGLAALCMEHFLQTLDEVTDKPGASPRELHVSHLLLIEGLRLYSEAATDPTETYRRVGSLVALSMEAERYLWRHRGRLIPYNDDDFKKLAQRCALMKAPVEVLHAMGTGRINRIMMEDGLDAAAIAVQLIDDLLDWHDDWQAGIYTHPIAVALAGSDQRAGENASPDFVERQLIQTGAARATLLLARNYLQSAYDCLVAARSSGVASFVRRLAGNVDTLRAEVSLSANIDETLTRFEFSVE